MKMQYLYEPLSYTNTGELYGCVSADLSPIGIAQWKNSTSLGRA